MENLFLILDEILKCEFVRNCGEEVFIELSIRDKEFIAIFVYDFFIVRQRFHIFVSKD